MDLDDFIEAMKIIFFIVLVIVVGFGSGVSLVNYAEKKTCSKYQEVSDKETRHEFFGGCYVKTGNGWLTMDQYNSVLVAKEGLQYRHQ